MLINPERVLRMSGFDLEAAGNELKLIMSKGDGFSSWQSEKKWEVFRHHVSQNPFYKSVVGHKKISSWEDVPVLVKSDYQRPLPALVSQGSSLRQLYIGNTSGSSGHPLLYAKNKFCHALAWALIRQRFGLYNISLQSMQARFYGIPLTGKSALAERAKDILMSRVRFPVFDLSEKRLNAFADKFRRLPFDYIYGYTNSIRHFCHYLLEKKIELKLLCPSLKCVIVTSEMCGEYDRKIIEQATGVPCIIEYGSSETGIIGFELPNGNMQSSDELLYLELDTDGSLLVTSLYNTAFPMIRYKIGDRVELVRDSVTGRSSIKTIMGRSDDWITLADGRMASGMTIYYMSRYLLERMSAIKELYVTQTGTTAFHVFYIGDDLNSHEQFLIKKSFATYLQPDLQIDIIKTDVIRRKANGKLQMFHSELTA